MDINKVIQKLVVFLIVLLLSGCAAVPPKSVAGLTELPEARLSEWNIPDNLSLQGENNTCRPVQLNGGKDALLELAAGNQGSLEYYQDNVQVRAASGNYKLQFLSTQGVGRIKVSAVKQNGEVLGAVGWVYTGPVPESAGAVKWIDKRYFTNYLGNWLETQSNLAALLVEQLPGLDLSQAARIRLSVEVGQGQHALLAYVKNTVNSAQILAVRPEKTSYAARVGEELTLNADFRNDGSQPLQDLSVKLVYPEGFGIIPVDNDVQVIAQLAPGKTVSLSWKVKAQRADAVNFGKPWQVSFAVQDNVLPLTVPVAVSDPRPGKIFYVMTEDLEPIDGAGYAKAWGNTDGWLQPEEYIVQMVNKAQALNQIAEKYGAKWTHYIAWPAVKAGEWAEERSTTGKWNEAVNKIKQSVTAESAKGHEYALHMHSDYDPDLQGNFLSYNAKIDGIWANHLRHGWAHSVFTEGDFSKHFTRTGILFDYQKILDELAMVSPNGQILTSRAGSFDFGSGIEDEAVSTKALQHVGLWGSSDADGNQMGITSGEYGREIYLARKDDINYPAESFAQLGIVEFRPTPKDYISYDNQSAAVMNDKAEQGMAYFTRQGGIKPGVHGIIGFTHAMFMLGEGDWQSTQGGQFTALDQHLNYLKTNYADKGLLTFGTGSDLVKAYLDYYTPNLLAVYGKKLHSGWGVSEYAVELLGRDIPISQRYTHTVSLKYPLYLRDSAYRIAVLKNGQPVYTTWGLPTPFNDIVFQVDDPDAVYTLKVYHHEFFYKIFAGLRGIKTKLSK